MKKRNVTKDLQKLAGAFYENMNFFDGIENGYIGVDCKRPFGDSNYECDILEIIGWDGEQDDGYRISYTQEQLDYARELYREKLVPYLKEEWKHYNILRTLR